MRSPLADATQLIPKDAILTVIEAIGFEHVASHFRAYCNRIVTLVSTFGIVSFVGLDSPAVGMVGSADPNFEDTCR